jgi:hypothetical protein
MRMVAAASVALKAFTASASHVTPTAPMPIPKASAWVGFTRPAGSGR